MPGYGTKRRLENVRFSAASRGKADIPSDRQSVRDFMSTRPKLASLVPPGGLFLPGHGRLGAKDDLRFRLVVKDMIAVQGHRRSHLRAASAARMIQAFGRFYSAFTFVRFSDFVKREWNQRALQPAMIQNDSGPPQGPAGTFRSNLGVR
jgi:hypothetical protein